MNCPEITRHFFDYEPFGAPLAQTGLFSRKSFIDKEKDEESDLGNFGVRSYDDNEGGGRFTSIDPMWEDYRAWSPYQYGLNNPLRMVDPSGKVPNDYFEAKTGEYLGTDKAKTDDIKLISREDFKKGDLEKSKFIDPLRISQDVATNIITYYYKQLGFDPKELHNGEVTADYDGVATTTGPDPYTKAGSQIFVGRQHFNTIMQNKYDVMNLLIHEHKHFKDHQANRERTVPPHYQDPAWEGDATIEQMNHPSWNKTSTVFQNHMIGAYGKYLPRKKK